MLICTKPPESKQTSKTYYYCSSTNSHHAHAPSVHSFLITHNTTSTHQASSHMERESNKQQQQPPWSYTSYGFMVSSSGSSFIWPPRSYPCSFCKREFRSAQALGGHMNVHRRDRARLRHGSPPLPLPLPPPAVIPNLNYPPPPPQYHRHRPATSSSMAEVSLELGVGVVRSCSTATTPIITPGGGPEEDGGLDLELRLGVFY